MFALLVFKTSTPDLKKVFFFNQNDGYPKGYVALAANVCILKKNQSNFSIKKWWKRGHNTQALSRKIILQRKTFSTYF